MKEFIEPQARLIDVDIIATESQIPIATSNEDGNPDGAPMRTGSVGTKSVTDFD